MRPCDACSCRQVELLRRKERNEAHLFMSVEVYTEDDFQSHQGSDLLEFEDVKEKCVGMLVFVAKKLWVNAEH